MHYWLIVILTDPTGSFLSKTSYEYFNQEQCSVAILDYEGMKDVNVLCVSDDHFRGIKQDNNVEYD